MDISFIIPAYNASRTIERCLQSIVPYLQQDCEAVVVSDGSTDNTEQIVRAFAATHDHVRLFNQSNKGQSEARNVAIRQAKGRFIWCLDSDDWLSDDSAMVLERALLQEDCDVLVVGRVEEFGTHSLSTPEVRNVQFASGVDYFRYASSQGLYRTQPWNMLVKRQLLIDNNIFFPVGRMFEDFPWGLNVLLHAAAVKMLDCHPYHWQRANERSLTHQANKRDADAAWIVDATASMLDEAAVGLSSTDPAFLLLVYRFISSSIMKKYIPMYGSNGEARQMVDNVRNNRLYQQAVRYVSTHYSGLKLTLLAILQRFSFVLYKCALQLVLR